MTKIENHLAAIVLAATGIAAPLTKSHAQALQVSPEVCVTQSGIKVFNKDILEKTTGDLKSAPDVEGNDFYISAYKKLIEENTPSNPDGSPFKAAQAIVKAHPNEFKTLILRFLDINNPTDKTCTILNQDTIDSLKRTFAQMFSTNNPLTSEPKIGNLLKGAVTKYNAVWEKTLYPGVVIDGPESK
jgi:hypothetical protein